METLIVTGGISLDVLIVGLITGKCMLASGISRKQAVLASVVSSVVFLLLLSLMVVMLIGVHSLAR